MKFGNLKKCISILLCLCMVLGMLPGIPLVASAAGTDGMLTIEMADSYGDGWNGNAIEIYANGERLDTATIGDGKTGTWSVVPYSHATYTFKWVKGSYPDETSFVIYMGTEEKCSAAGNSYRSGDTILTLEPVCSAPVFENDICTLCGNVCGVHSFTGNVCSICGFACGTDAAHNWDMGVCTVCAMECAHASWADYVCDNCGYACGSDAKHSFADSICTICGFACGTDAAHDWQSGVCAVCVLRCAHESITDGVCDTCSGTCGTTFAHSFNSDNQCTVCGFVCLHTWESGRCTVCGRVCTHESYSNGFCTVCDDYQPATDADGDGYYDIANGGNLYWFAKQVNDGNRSIYGELTADIVVNETVLNADGTLKGDGSDLRAWTPAGYSRALSFNGKFNGNDHTISGLYYSGDGEYVGLFGCVRDGRIENVGVVDSYFSTTSKFANMGAVAGYLYNAGNSEIINCYNAGAVYGYNAVGGVVGFGQGGTVTGCYNTGWVSSNDRAGGVVGNAENTMIANCYNTGRLQVSCTYAGGVVGRYFHKDGSVVLSNCYNTGDVVNTKSYGNAGGVVGNCATHMADCYSIGSVSAASYAGGLAGLLNGASLTMSNCYYNSDAFTGGASGESDDTVINCAGLSIEQFYSGEVCWLLNGSSSEGAWKQTLGNDTLPGFTGETVYQVSGTYCTGGEATVYSNTDANAGAVHKDETNDHLCDGCGETASECRDWNKDHLCDVCSEVLSQHSGGTATCSAKAKCSYCGEEYGETDPSNHDSSVSFDANGFCPKGCYAPAVQNADGYYEIKNAGQLYWFAQLVNLKGELAAKGILTADIDLGGRTWYPIGLYNDPAMADGDAVIAHYSGVFDGNGHTVSNFKAIGNGSQGFVGYSAAAAIVKNLGVINAEVSGWNAGAVMAYSGTVENCYALDCKITASSNASDVLYAGSIAGTQQATVRNSFAYNCTLTEAEGESATMGAIGGKTPENSYYGKLTVTSGTLRSNDGETEMSEEQFASGEVAYLLGEAWGQTIGEEAYPVLGGETVYYTYTSCDEAETDMGYSNNADRPAHTPGEDDGDCTTAILCAVCDAIVTEGKASHDYQNGFCQACDDYQPCEGEGTTGSPYLIANAGNLYWYAAQINDGNNTLHGKLTEDIIVNENVLDAEGNLNDNEFRSWTPIGCDAFTYRATFDGADHTVSGLYFNDAETNSVGLFGYVGYGTVKNVGVVDSWFCGRDYVGGVVGLSDQITLSNCYNTGTVTGRQFVGGVLGNGRGTISCCYNTGTVIGSNVVGGVMGMISYSTIENCYNMGSVNGNNTVGGVLGYDFSSAVDSPAIMSNCYNAGSVNGTNYVGGVLGSGSITRIIKCYYLDTCGAAGQGTAKTAEQFASGEVAYLLGEAWGQTIGEEAYPVLGGETVYYIYTSCDEAETDMGYSNNADRPAHTPEEDDGDCTTAILCAVCDAIVTEGKASHTPDEDDDDCTTAILCAVCGTVTTAARDAHIPGDDDDNCLTPVFCIFCSGIAIEAKEEHNFVGGNCGNGGCDAWQSFTMTYYIDGEVAKTETYTCGTAYYPWVAEDKDDLTFLGWAEEEGGELVYAAYDCIWPDEDMEFYAVYGKVYTVTYYSYNYDTGTHYEDGYTASSSGEIKLATEYPYFYKFVGWDENGDGVADYACGEVITLTENLSLYAVVAPFTASIDLGAQDAVFQDENGEPIVSVTGEMPYSSVKFTSFPMRPGYIFQGFVDSGNGVEHSPYTDEETGETYMELQLSEDQVTLTALWAECAHETWLDATCTAPKTCGTCGVTEGDALGHNWKDATCTTPKTCGTCGVTEGEKADHRFEDGMCIYGCGTLQTFTVTFAGYGTEYLSSVTVEPGSVITLPCRWYDLAYSGGYVFAGYNTEEDGSGETYMDCTEYTVTESVTLYAQWAEIAVGDALLNSGEYVDVDGNITTTRPEGGYAHFDSGTLTLHDFSYDGEGYLFIHNPDNDSTATAPVYYGMGNLTVVVEGKNVLSNPNDNEEGYGIRGDWNVTVSGIGSLTLEVGSYALFSGSDLVMEVDTLVLNVKSSHGNVVRAVGDITLNSGSVSIEGGETAMFAEGLYSQGNININGGALTIVSDKYGLECSGTLNVAGGTVSITAGEYEWYKAVLAHGGITLENVELQFPENGRVVPWGSAYTIVGSKGNAATYVAISAEHSHTEETIPGKAPTCTESGLTDGVKCSACGEVIKEQEVIPASGHSYGNDDVCDICGNASRIDLMLESYIVDGAQNVTVNSDGSWTITGSIVLAPQVTFNYNEYAYLAQMLTANAEVKITLLDRDPDGMYSEHWIDLYSAWGNASNYYPTGTYDSVDSIKEVYDWNVETSGWGNTGTATVRAIYIDPIDTVTLYTLELRLADCKHIDEDNNGLCDTCGCELSLATLQSCSLTLDGNIAINYYMSIADSVLNDPDAYMLFTQEGKEPVKVYLKDCELSQTRGRQTYVFSYSVNAKEMTDEIKAQFFYGETSTEEYLYSVKTYVDNMRAKNADAGLMQLLDSMLHYGAASQIQFNYHTERLANEGLQTPDYSAVSIDGYPTIKGQGTSRVTFVSATLVLLSETTLQLFFRAEEGAEDFTVSYNGEELALTLSPESGRYYVEITNISAPKLDEVFTLTLTEGGETAEVVYGPLTYCASVLKNAKGQHSRSLQDTVAALYLYNQAANAYFETN